MAWNEVTRTSPSRTCGRSATKKPPVSTSMAAYSYFSEWLNTSQPGEKDTQQHLLQVINDKRRFLISVNPKDKPRTNFILSLDEAKKFADAVTQAIADIEDGRLAP